MGERKLTPEERRRALMTECGLDAFAQPAEVWLSMAVAAEARGHGQYQRDCERAMEISAARRSALEARK